MFAILLLLGAPAAAALCPQRLPAGAIEMEHGGSIVEGVPDRKLPSDSQRVTLGSWGGDQARLELTEEEGQIEFACAHGSLQGPIRLDRQGRFAVSGQFVQEAPGPIRLGHEPKPRPASYSGAVVGKKMTLQVRLTDADEAIGTYTLELGSPGRVRKCR
jgi:hypothetical protein